MKDNQPKKLLLLLFVIFIISGLLAYAGIFDKKVKFNYSYPIIKNQTRGIDYILNLQYESKGAFIQGKPINLDINFIQLAGAQFIEGNNIILISNDCKVCGYPLNYSSAGCLGGAINLNTKEEGKMLVGKEKIIFLNYGNCGNMNIIYTTTNGTFSFKIEESFTQISPLESWLTIQSNRRIFSLTLILIGLGIIQILQNLDKKDSQEQ